MISLATSQYFYTHSLQVHLLIFLIFFPFGLLLGWTLWRHGKTHADRVESLNDDLRERKDTILKTQQHLSKLAEDLPD